MVCNLLCFFFHTLKILALNYSIKGGFNYRKCIINVTCFRYIVQQLFVIVSINFIDCHANLRMHIFCHHIVMDKVSLNDRFPMVLLGLSCF